MKLMPEKPLILAKAESLLQTCIEARAFPACVILLEGWTEARPRDKDAWHTLVVLISTMALCVLLLLKDRIGALQLVAASVGAGIFTTTIKGYIDRARPEVVTQLVEVSGLSYPSGHSVAATSLYLTVAIVVSRHLQRTGH